MDAQTLVDYAKSLDCVHCGLCLNTCPTYRLTGAEPSSPRGRIHLMRAVAEGHIEADDDYAEELDFCLLCRNCESVCPSGVQFGAMMEHARGALSKTGRRTLGARLARWIGFRVLLPHRFALRSAAALGRLAQTTGLLKLAAKLGGKRAKPMLDAPSIPPRMERRRLPAVTPASGEPRGIVMVLEGCVMPELFGRVNRATVEVLSAAGYESRVPRAHVCCGSLHAHNGDLGGARELAMRTIELFETDAPIVVNSAGCSSHMKEYAHLFQDDLIWKERATRFSSRVRDFSEFFASREAREGLTRALAHAKAGPKLGPELGAELGRVTYDDPCHLCHGQKIRREPRALLALVPGLVRVEMPDSESCCGSAGIYSLLRPADSAAVLEPKLRSLRASGARTLVTANPGCQLQWETGVKRAGLDVRVVHVAEVLARAVRT
jgi:glycolate oxidase iron-sulfur subunit